MSHASLQDHLRKFYGEKSLSPEAVVRMAALSHAGAHASAESAGSDGSVAARTGLPIIDFARAGQPGRTTGHARAGGPPASAQPFAWWKFVSAVAAGVALMLAGAGVYRLGMLDARAMYLDGQAPGTVGPGTISNFAVSEGSPQLVAVRFYVNGCPISAAMTPVFVDLTERYGMQPVLFTTLDISDETMRRQARCIATELGIECVYQEPVQSGMIKLVDRRKHTVLATLTKREELPEVERVLERALH